MDETSVGGEKVERKAGGGDAAARRAPAGGEAPREDTKNQSPTPDFRVIRRQRFHRREWLWLQPGEDRDFPMVEDEELHPLAKRLAQCGRVRIRDDSPMGRSLNAWGAGGSVLIRKHGDGVARTAGVMACGMGWTCPVCASTIAAGRAVEVETAARRWVSGWERTDPDTQMVSVGVGGGTLLFGTFTIPHAKELGSDLAALMRALSKAWSKVAGGGKAWENDRRKYGIAGWIRTTELTVGRRNGWHPHVHVLFFVRRRLLARELMELRANLHRRWTTGVTQSGFPPPSETRGVQLTRAKVGDEGKELAQYLTKVGDTKNTRWVGDEIARGDSKSGRRPTRISSFELLDIVQDRNANGKRRAWAREEWWKYAKATSGQVRIRWSRGLRALLEMETLDDSQILEQQEAEARAAVVECVIVPYNDFQKVTAQKGGLAQLLEAMENDGLDGVMALIPGAREGPVELDPF